MKSKLFSFKNLIICLLAVIIAAVAAALCVKAFAEERAVTISGSTALFTSGDSEVWAYPATVDDGEGGEKTVYYSMFTFPGEDDTVTFRKDLALRWFEDSAPVGETDESASPVGAGGYFSMRIGFDGVDFDKFTVKFETQQYSATKENKTENYVIFFKNGDGVSAVITDDKDEEMPAEAAVLSTDGLTVKFDEYLAEKQVDGETLYGVYEVSVSDGEKSVTGEFSNIGGTYSDFSSSSTRPVTPLTFSAEFPEDRGVENIAKLIMYELNGQSFELKLGSVEERDGHFEGGRIADNAAPVLCLNEELRYIDSGDEINFDYAVIDVLTSSPSSEVYYYILTEEQATSAEEINYDNYLDKDLFEKVSSEDDRYLLHHKGDYTPVAADFAPGAVFGENLKPTGAVKICLKLTDTTATGGLSAYTMLDWYVPDEYKISVNDGTFLALAKDEKGLTFAYTNDGDCTSDPNGSGAEAAAWKEAVEKYAKKVEELTTAKIEGSSDSNPTLSAGNNNYFYLPVAKDLFSDDGTAYEDLKFSVYYIRAGSRQQNTGRDYNNLTINLTAKGFYEFTVYATDSAGNEMYYYDENGVKQTYSSSDIWTMYDDEDKKDYLPWFSFEVTYNGVSVEKPEMQATGYVGTEYTSASFDINGVSYDTTYRLYIFNKDLWKNDFGAEPTYAQYLENIIGDADKFNSYRDYFHEIKPAADLAEGDENYEESQSYNFSSSGTSFTPQEANAFYCIKLEVKDRGTAASPVESVLGVVASDRPAPLKGETQWLKNNVATVALLCVAGAALVGILLLIFIRPRNKGDIDEDELLTARKAAGKKKKN